MAAAASEAMPVRRRFLILVRRTPQRAITSRPPRGGATNYPQPMHFAELTAPELRVLGCLIEKRWTTPEQYPLSLNALRLACNQTTNRDPVVDYDEATVRRGLDRLARRGWTRLASGPGSRAAKFRHLFDEALRLDDAEISLLAGLMLRGPQTVGELKQRTERLHGFASLEEVEQVLARLAER